MKANNTKNHKINQPNVNRNSKGDKKDDKKTNKEIVVKKSISR